MKMTSGDGLVTFENGESYNGKWLYGELGIMFSGFGTHTFSDRTYFMGTWKNGEKDGNGKIFFEEGSLKIKGTWDNGNLVKV